MKTELEQLRENTERQYVKERFDEVTVYLENLFRQADIAFKESKKASHYEFAFIVTWLIALIFGPNGLEQLAWLLWVLLTLYNLATVHRKPYRIMGEIDGALKILEILGFAKIDDDRKGKRRKKRKFKSPYAGLAELWEKIKEKQRKEAYA